MKKVSLLVPVYGAELYIEQCARSLFEQSYAACEFIFVNDASPDDSIARLKRVVGEYANRQDQVKIVELEVNGGVAAARNAALDAATGDYLLFVDADDYVAPLLVENLVVKSIECDAQLCNAWCVSVDNAGGSEKTPELWLSPLKEHLAAVIGQSHLVPNHLRGMLFERSLFEDNGLRFTPRIDFGEDYSLLPSILCCAKRVATLKEYLYFYRVENAGSYMNNIGEKQILSYLAAEQKVFEFVGSLPDAAHYRRAAILGKVNIKKWIYKRGVQPTKYNVTLFGEAHPHIKYPALRLYNRVVDGGNCHLIKIFSVAINLPLFLRTRLKNYRSRSAM